MLLGYSIGYWLWLGYSLAWAKAKAKAWARARALAYAPRKGIVPLLKRVDAIERSEGHVIGQAREHQQRHVVPGPLLEPTEHIEA